MSDARETREVRLLKIEEMLKDLTKEIRNPTKIIESLKKVENSNREISNKLGRINEEFEKMVEKIGKQAEEINFLRAENLRVKAEVKEFREFINNTEREKRRNWLEISGIPIIENEVNNEIIKRIHEKCNVPYKSEDVVESFRKKVRNNRANFIIKYKDTGLRDNIQKNIRRIKLNSENLGYKQEKKSIFANDCLSKAANDLFWRVRKAKYDNNWKEVWVARSRIFIKRRAEEEQIMIETLEDLITLTK